MPKMLIPILSILAVAGTFLGLGILFVTSGQNGTIGIGLGIIGAVLIIAGLRALEGYLSRGGEIAGRKITLPSGMAPFWVLTLAALSLTSLATGLLIATGDIAYWQLLVVVFLAGTV